MNGFERNIIENNKYELVNETKHSEKLVESLRKRGVITEYLYQELHNIVNEEEKLKLLYECVTTRGPDAYEHLMSALYETDNDDLGKMLNMKRYNMDQYMKIEVKKSEKRCDLDPLSYKMTSNPKGYALIINFHNYCYANGHSEFLDENVPKNPDIMDERRFGSYRDVANLYTLLSQLGYEISILHDLTKDTFIEQIEKFRDKTEHFKADSCIVVIMGHGYTIDDRCAIKTYDSKVVYSSDIWTRFNSVNCPALHGKPKLFIFQNCRGEENDMGVDMDVVTSKTEIVRFSNGDCGTLSQQMSQVVADVAKMNPANYESTEILRRPNNEDFILIYPSSPGTTSKRDPVLGSWLIEKICEVFMKNAWNSDVFKMLKMVREEIRKKYSSIFGMQTTWTHDSAKYVYFNPGLYDDEVSLNKKNKKIGGGNSNNNNHNTW